MSDIFISHVEEDADLALRLALGLEGAGYATWCYEVDALPGAFYIEQVAKAIEKCQVILLIVSPHSLGSHQVTNEVIRAYEDGKYFVPVLRDVTDVEFKRRQPVWRQCLGAATSVKIPTQGVEALMPDIADGIKSLGVNPRSKTDTMRIDRIQSVLGNLQAPSFLQGTGRTLFPEAAKKSKRGKPIRPLIIGITALVVITIVVVGIILAKCSFGTNNIIPPSPTPTATQSIVEKGELILTDSFDDNRNNWNLDTGLDQAYIEDGKLNLVSKVPNKGFKSSPNFTTPIGEFTIEVETKKISGVDGNTYGLTFGEISGDEYFTFGITGNGYYRLCRWAGGQWEYLIPYVYSSAINKGNSINKLAVVCTSSEVKLYVNEHYLEIVSTGRNMRGGIGLIVNAEGIQVAFDNLSVYQSSN
jgi:hypothetical protein